MAELFLKVIHMSLSASWLILAVLLLRVVLKKAPKWVTVLLWGIVAVRLICPFAMERPVSLIPASIGNGDLVSEWMDDYVGNVDIHHPDSIYYDAAIGAGREPIADGEGGYYVVTQHDQLGEPSTIANTVMPVLSIVWVLGMIFLVLYTGISYFRLHSRIDTAVLYKHNIFQSENVSAPFVLGIIRPRIYIPFHMDEKDLEHVVAHERAHIQRKDHWWKPLGFLMVTIHWFNPMIWVAYVLFCRDIELACDEKVIRKMDNGQKAGYAQALLTCSVNRRMVAICPLAFGEVSVKERVTSIMNYKKPAFGISVMAVVACIVIAVCFLTDPISTEGTEIRLMVYDGEKTEIDSLSEDVPGDISIVNIYEVTDSGLADENLKNNKLITMVKYYEMSDGTWKTDNYTYQYRLEITGRMGGASKDSTFVFLSNIDDISFEQAWKAAGFSSNMNDYFKEKDAKFVAMK